VYSESDVDKPSNMTPSSSISVRHVLSHLPSFSARSIGFRFSPQPVANSTGRRSFFPTTSRKEVMSKGDYDALDKIADRRPTPLTQSASSNPADGNGDQYQQAEPSSLQTDCNALHEVSRLICSSIFDELQVYVWKLPKNYVGIESLGTVTFRNYPRRYIALR
jgi:hypothetical protein